LEENFFPSEYFNDLYKVVAEGGLSFQKMLGIADTPTERMFPGMACSEEYVAVVGGGQLQRFGVFTALVAVGDVFILYDSQTETWTDYSFGGPGKRSVSLAQPNRYLNNSQL
jgi:hypothetical protein